MEEIHFISLENPVKEESPDITDVAATSKNYSVDAIHSTNQEHAGLYDNASEFISSDFFNPVNEASIANSHGENHIKQEIGHSEDLPNSDTTENVCDFASEDILKRELDDRATSCNNVVPSTDVMGNIDVGITIKEEPLDTEQIGPPNVDVERDSGSVGTTTGVFDSRYLMCSPQEDRIGDFEKCAQVFLEEKVEGDSFNASGGNAADPLGDVEPAEEVNSSRYTCALCSRTFARKAGIRFHLQTHTNNGLYKCDKCDMSFVRLRNLLVHSKSHRDRECKICHENFADVDAMHKHLNLVHIKCDRKRRHFSCVTCQKVFVKFHNCLRHVMAIHHGTKWPKPADRCTICEVCNLVLKNSSLRRHLRAHDRKSYIKCCTCSKAFATRSNFLRHRKLVHKDVTGELPGKSFDANVTVDRVNAVSYDLRISDGIEGRPTVNEVGLPDDFTNRKEIGNLSHVTIKGDPDCRARVPDAIENTVNEVGLPDGVAKRSQVCKFSLVTIKSSPDLCAGNSSAVADVGGEPIENETSYYPDHPSQTWKCNFCPDKQFQRRFLLKYHMLKAHKIISGSEYKCNTCDATFVGKQQLAGHTKLHEAIAGVPLQHQTTGNSINDKECHICHKTFIRSASLKEHLLVSHSATKSFKCESCPEAFTSLRFLADHKNQKHNVNKQLNECNICHKTYSRARTLKYHLQTHKKSVGFKCEDCGMDFTLARYLHRHRNKHHPSPKDRKSVYCTVCGKVFAAKNFQKHLETKSHIANIQGNKCKICDKTFTRVKSLQTHLKRHVVP